jgi:hypothetical protein
MALAAVLARRIGARSAGETGFVILIIARRRRVTTIATPRAIEVPILATRPDARFDRT